MHEESITKSIKTLRKKKKITLQQLADMSGLTKGYLSKIERAKKAPPYSTLNKIAMALDVDAASLLGHNLDRSLDRRISFTKKHQRKRIQQFGSIADGSLYGYRYEALAYDKHGKNMEPYILIPDFKRKELVQYEGEGFIYTLEGIHGFSYDGKEYVLNKGDSMYFDANALHGGYSIGKKRAKVLFVLYSYRR